MNACDDEAAEQKRHDDGTDDGTAPQLAVRIEHNRRCRVVLMRRLVLLLEEFALSCVSHSFIMHFVCVLHRPSPSMCFLLLLMSSQCRKRSQHLSVLWPLRTFLLRQGSALFFRSVKHPEDSRHEDKRSYSCAEQATDD